MQGFARAGHIADNTTVKMMSKNRSGVPELSRLPSKPDSRKSTNKVANMTCTRALTTQAELQDEREHGGEHEVQVEHDTR